MPDLARTLAVGAQLLARYRYTLDDGFVALDPERTIPELVRVLAEHGVAYAIIGGVAAQIWRRDPRTTLDVDLAVTSYDGLPVAALAAAGFTRTGRFEHSENWRAPDGSPVQFTDDPALSTAIATAVELPLGGATVRVISAVELVRAKLRAAADPARRASKRLQDRSDVAAVLESHPEVRDQLSTDERARVDVDR